MAHVLLADALGTGDLDLAAGLLAQLANAGSPGKPASEQDLAFMLALVRAIAPTNETEALLAVQMAAIHRPPWWQPNVSAWPRPSCNRTAPRTC